MTSLRKFLSLHTPAGRYLSEVQQGIEEQRARFEELTDPEVETKFWRFVRENNISGRVQYLFTQRG